MKIIFFDIKNYSVDIPSKYLKTIFITTPILDILQLDGHLIFKFLLSKKLI